MASAAGCDPAAPHCLPADGLETDPQIPGRMGNGGKEAGIDDDNDNDNDYDATSQAVQSGEASARQPKATLVAMQCHVCICMPVCVCVCVCAHCVPPGPCSPAAACPDAKAGICPALPIC